jgi:predicted  nucleic acid-binding Zn-ribbon protein
MLSRLAELEKLEAERAALKKRERELEARCQQLQAEIREIRERITTPETVPEFQAAVDAIDSAVLIRQTPAVIERDERTRNGEQVV